MVEQPNGAVRCLSIKTVPRSSLLNFTSVHFSTFPNIFCAGSIMNFVEKLGEI